MAAKVTLSYDSLAQLAEQLPFKQWVRSSNLRRVTKKATENSLFFGGFLLFSKLFRPLQSKSV